MAAKTKLGARVKRAKKERGEKIAGRLKEIAAGKADRKGSRGRALSREDLESLRDGRA